MAQRSEFVANRRHQTNGHPNIAANGQHKHHKKEDGRKHLRYEFHFRNRIWIGDERQAGATFDDLPDVVDAGLVGQIAEDAEYDDAGDQRRERVEDRQDEGVSAEEYNS